MIEAAVSINDELLDDSLTDEQKSEIKELFKNLKDPWWRITSGKIYKIIIKGEVSEDGEQLTEDTVLPFIPNRHQLRFMKRMWNRNLILKARQLGFTTLVAILWLDHALYNPNARCGIIAQDRQNAEIIFRDKVMFAYNNMPESLKAMFPTASQNKSEVVFAHNNSSVRVATSLRGGTIHRLHVSEYGKICAKSPDKAKEVKTGSIPAVPTTGIIIIESTAEGKEGDYHDKVQASIKREEAGREANRKDFKLHFYPWFAADEYRINPDGVNITDKQHEYFNEIEVLMNTKIDLEQRAWYVVTLENDFSWEKEVMNREYPSTPKEAFEVSIEGNYYHKQMSIMRKQGRILKIPKLDLPVFTFWDIGNGDGCAVWFMQMVGMEYRFIDYEEGHGETIGHYVKLLQSKNYIWGKHFMPHDADHKRLSEENKSVKEMFEDKGLLNIEIVPRITNIQDGIQQTREAMPEVYIDKESCALGITRLDNYKKQWNEKQERWSELPKHDINSEGADSFRQFAQAKALGLIKVAGQNRPKARKSGNWRTA